MSLEEVVIRSSASSGDYLALRAEPWDSTAHDYYEGPDVQVELRCGDLQASASLPAYIADAERLAPLFHEIDAEWRGWDGQKRAGQAERDWLAVSATHDGKGHVRLEVHLSAGWPVEAEWTVRASLMVDVGSAADTASRLDRWLAIIWPAEKRWRSPAP